MGKRLTAQQIMDNYEPEWRGNTTEESDDQFWDNKLKEAYSQVSKGNNLYEDIMQHGQKKPILLTQGDALYTRPAIIDGHHRLAVMHHINPQQFVKYRHRRED